MYDKRKITMAPLLVLLIGDILMLLLFTISGRKDHDLDFSWSATFMTTLPFIIAYLISVILLRFSPFRAKAFHTLKHAIFSSFMITVLTVPIGMILRSIMYEKQIFTAFFIVSCIAIFIFLTVWRIVFTWVRRFTVR